MRRADPWRPRAGEEGRAAAEEAGPPGEEAEPAGEARPLQILDSSALILVLPLKRQNKQINDYVCASPFLFQLRSQIRRIKMLAK